MIQVIVARLAGWPAISSVVAGRVVPVVLRQATSDPALVYRLLYSNRTYTLGGPAGWTESQIQFNCWSLSYGVARALADEVRRALDAWAALGDGVQLVSVNDGADDYAEEYEMVGTTVIVTVRHQE